ncbi:glycosyltransferase family 4 protein [Tenacibaculum aquimarinum]|uniref:glycosyltransferase family 4 protein n=1 Tax=Tenacibaculum aquimarinum TaxID=2910675 RepID=UPI001F0B3F0E|nr:glycosyltransferase family 4 protein [Tenacibaculum aquimarinum]MCH3884998.1 glycosyltransferase family 4 protein [Tenacibaculum aquimarinum]
MIRAIQLIDSLDVGGAEVLAVNIANLLLKENIESHLCVTRKEGLLKDKVSRNVNYLFLNRKSTFDFKAILKLKNYIMKNNISIIHAHASSSFIAFCVKLLMPKIKIVWHNHTGANINLNGVKLYAIKFQTLFFSFIINTNKDLNFWTTKKLKFKKSAYISNFGLLSDERKLTTLNGKDGKRIVCLASLRKEKDHLILLKAFNLLINENKDWTLHLVGRNHKDEYAFLINNYIIKNNLEHLVFLYDTKPDIKNILSQATIGVLSSKSEGLPIALLEYGLAKLSVLVTDVGECANVVEDLNGIVDSNNYLEFSKKLNRMINNKSLRTNISLSLYEKVKEEYSKERFTMKLIEIYKNLC